MWWPHGWILIFFIYSLLYITYEIARYGPIFSLQCNCATRSDNKVQATEKTRPHEYATPEEQVAKCRMPFQEPGATQLDQRDLSHLEKKQVTPQLLEQTPHDEFVY